MQIRLLGGVSATADDGNPIDIGPAKCQALLAAVALSVGTAVPVNRLVDLIWGEEPPRTAVKTLQTYVARLRRGLGSDALARAGAEEEVGPLVELLAAPDPLDRLEGLVAELVPLLEVDPQRGELALQVAGGDAQHEAAAGGHVQRRGRLRGEERVPVGQHQHVGLESDARRGGRRAPQAWRERAASTPGRAVCSIYRARPAQCRTWPFWPENLLSKRDWHS